MLQLGHHAARPEPEMRSEIFTAEQPHEIPTGASARWDREHWSLGSLKATASTPSGDVVLSAVGPAPQSCSRLAGVLLK